MPTATAVSLPDLVRGVYDNTEDKADRKAMAAIVFAELDDDAINDLVFMALELMLGDLNAAERPKRTKRRGRSKSKKKTFTLKLLEILWESPNGLIPIGAFTDADLAWSAERFSAQEATATERKGQVSDLRVALRKYNVVEVKGLPEEVYSDILS